MVKEKYLPYVEPEQPPEPPKTEKQIKKEKRENFWYYNKTKFIVGFCVIAAVLLAWQPWNTTIQPDYRVGLMSKYYWNDDQISELESMLRPYGKDLNGDGVVTVQVTLYLLSSDEESGMNPQEIQANTTRLVGDLQTGEVIVFLSDEANIENFGISEGLFARVKDLSVVEEGEKVSVEDVSIPWKDCDAISKNLRFSNFTKDFYFCIRGFAGTLEGKDLEYNQAVELFARITSNQPYDSDLLELLLKRQSESSDGASGEGSAPSGSQESSSAA